MKIVKNKTKKHSAKSVRTAGIEGSFKYSYRQPVAQVSEAHVESHTDKHRRREGTQEWGTGKQTTQKNTEVTGLPLQCLWFDVSIILPLSFCP